MGSGYIRVLLLHPLLLLHRGQASVCDLGAFRPTYLQPDVSLLVRFRRPLV